MRRETRDLHLCIEWAATQKWCSGKVGMERHLVLREQPVARGGDAAAAASPPICAWRAGTTPTADGNRHAASSAPSASTGRTCR